MSSAIFHMNGNFYQDHAGCDLGGIAIYLLGAPISVMWGSMYSPHVPGSWGRNLFLPEADLPNRWTSPISLTKPISTFCSKSMTVKAHSFSASTQRADSMVAFDNGWSRQITLYKDHLVQPIVRIRDSNSNSVSSIMSLNMMAKNSVVIPGGGEITPTPAAAGSVEPTVGTPFNLPSGQPEMRFTGQWGVSWDVFVVNSNGSGEAYIGEWGHEWAPTVESAEYRAVTRGKPFSERQYILRVKNGATSDVVIVPYRTGNRPSDLAVSRVSGGIAVRADGVMRNLAD